MVIKNIFNFSVIFLRVYLNESACAVIVVCVRESGPIDFKSDRNIWQATATVVGFSATCFPEGSDVCVSPLLYEYIYHTIYTQQCTFKYRQDPQREMCEWESSRLLEVDFELRVRWVRTMPADMPPISEHRWLYSTPSLHLLCDFYLFKNPSIIILLGLNFVISNYFFFFL